MSNKLFTENNPPSWARYKATDADGTKHWFETKPVKLHDGWFNPIGGKGKIARIDCDDDYWFNSLTVIEQGEKNEH